MSTRMTTKQKSIIFDMLRFMMKHNQAYDTVVALDYLMEVKWFEFSKLNSGRKDFNPFATEEAYQTASFSYSYIYVESVRYTTLNMQLPEDADPMYKSCFPKEGFNLPLLFKDGPTTEDLVEFKLMVDENVFKDIDSENVQRDVNRAWRNYQFEKTQDRLFRRGV